MAKLTEEQQQARALARAQRRALAAEEDDRRQREQHARWDREGTMLTREELEAGVPCRGCGEPIIDGLGGFPPLNHLTPEQKTEYEREEERYRARHGECRSHRWAMQGSRTLHCGFCCPPPPLSLSQLEAIGKILRPAAREPRNTKDLDDWELTLRCGHVCRVQVHRSNQTYSAQVAGCPECGERRGVVATKHVGPSGDAEGQIARERLSSEIQAAKDKLERQRRAMEKTEKIIREMSAQLGGED